jgi:hypothetical protein
LHTPNKQSKIAFFPYYRRTINLIQQDHIQSLRSCQSKHSILSKLVSKLESSLLLLPAASEGLVAAPLARSAVPSSVETLTISSSQSNAENPTKTRGNLVFSRLISGARSVDA